MIHRPGQARPGSRKGGGVGPCQGKGDMGLRSLVWVVMASAGETCQKADEIQESEDQCGTETRGDGDASWVPLQVRAVEINLEKKEPVRLI